MSLHILIDSGFWIALLDTKKDPAQTVKAKKIFDSLTSHKLIIPFPTLYEFVNSRLSRRTQREQLEEILKKPNIEKISAEKYKEGALHNFFVKTKFYTEDKSLVDEILVLMMEDVNLKIDYIISFDPSLNNMAVSIGKRTLDDI